MYYLIFATNNAHKAAEMKPVLGKDFTVTTLTEAGLFIDIPEPHDTLEKNAAEKSSVVYNLTKADCFSEDTGLEVDALRGEPGVKSARYSDDRLFNDNIDKLLYHLRCEENRKARFKTVISLIFKGKEYKFDGLCKGTIIANRRGENGFGYDAVFMPDGSDKTFAQMDMEEKNRFSHRKKAAEKLVQFFAAFSGK